MRLVVVVPGLHGHTKRMRLLLERLREEPGFGPDEAHWLLHNHESRIWSTGTLEQVGRRLNAVIAAEWIRHRGFDDVVLIGHSMGGVILRQAYLLGAGGIPGEAPGDWAVAVSRIVLLASLNRGVERKKAAWYIRCAAYVARITPFAPHFTVLDLVRGSTFLTNLRVNWIRHFAALRSAAPGRSGAGKPPIVVQLLGTDDGIVGPEDSKDVLAFPRAHHLSVPDASHMNLHRLEFAPDPDLRYAVLRRGIVESFPDDEGAVASSDPVRRVVFLLHGIRASSVDGWVEGLERRIKLREGDRVSVKNPTYGYFTAARFALPSVRKKNIAVFQDWYTEEFAKHPGAEFDIVAHSNGTYILGHSLLHTPGMRFTNVALAGSVLPQDFWQRFKSVGRQVGRVRNDRANRDWPVALLCNALAGIRMRDVGTGGFAGFLGDFTHEVAYYAGGHGEALSSQRLDRLVDFVLTGESEEPSDLTTPGYYRQLSNSMPYVAVLILLLVGGAIGWFVLQGGQFHAERAVAIALGFVASYIALDIA